MTKKDFLKKSVRLSIGSVLGCMLFLFFTSPANLPVFFLLIIPVLFAVFCVGVSRIIGLVFFEYSGAAIRRISIVIGAGALLLSLLGSLGQLGFQDVLLASALITGVVFYLRRFQQA